jgi:hypothetical protein
LENRKGLLGARKPIYPAQKKIWLSDRQPDERLPYEQEMV